VKRLLQVAAAIAVAASIGFLFVRSARNARAEPYTISPEHLRGWTIVRDDAPDASGVIVALRPPQRLAPQLFQQVFTRAMESLNAPAAAAMPLILHQEFEQAFRGRVEPDALMAVAREAGLEDALVEPVCLAHRRESQPGVTRQLYFAVFRVPAFHAFRLKAAALLNQSGSASNAFDPEALSPVVFVGASDAGFRRWLPLPKDVQADCVAPIATSR
jgi:hypothetical protein